MKKTLMKPFLLGCFGMAVVTTLPSCVDPYAQGPGPQQSVTTYRAGYEVRTLPPGYRTEEISGTRYYSHNGTYYRQRSGRYVVVEAPRQQQYRDRQDRQYSDRDRQDRGYSDRGRTQGREQIITTLPRGARIVKYRGSDYYQVQDTYYQQRGAGYVIVTRPY